LAWLLAGPATVAAQPVGPLEVPGPGMDVLGVREVFEGKVVKGAPYKAEAVTEIAQPLADGNKISRRTASLVSRDSSGRTRREVTLATVGPVLGPGVPRHIFIHDPVAGTTFILEPDRKIARRMPGFVGHEGPGGRGRHDAEGRPGPGGRFFNQRVKGPGPEGAEAPRQTEPLGSQTIDGLEATGTRTTSTIPAGAIGNERPIKVVSERWYSPELQVVISSSHHDPRFGDNTYRLTNIERVEPDKSLFEVPADYTVKEGPPDHGNFFFKREAPKEEE